MQLMFRRWPNEVTPSIKPTCAFLHSFIHPHPRRHRRHSEISPLYDKMNKLCLVFLGALLLALHLASQVQAQTTTVSSRMTNATVTRNVTATIKPTTRAFNATLSSNSTTTANVTQDKNGCGRTEVSFVLFSLVLAGFLHGWS